MRAISKNWNTDENYWQMNPIIKTISQFNKLYTSDKSKNKQKSSKIMWAIALFLDPNDSNVWRNVFQFLLRVCIILTYQQFPLNTYCLGEFHYKLYTGNLY